MNSKINRNRKLIYLWLGLATLLIIYILYYGFDRGIFIATKYTPLIETTSEIQLDVTSAHLWFEEILSGDRDEDMSRVWNHLDRAEQNVRLMLEGNKVDGLFFPLENEEMKSILITIGKKVSEFKKATGNRLEKVTVSAAGTNIDQEYDAIFQSLLIEANSLKKALKNHIQQEVQYFVSLQFIHLALALLLAFVVGIVLFRSDKAFLQSENRYRTFFEESPIPLWEEDFSLVKNEIDRLKQNNIHNFEKYFAQNPEKVSECAAMVNILDLNNAVLELHEAESKEDLLQDLSVIFTEESFKSFKEELIAIAEGKSKCEFEARIKTLTGREKYVHLKWAVIPGYEQSMERILISTENIDERKQAEFALTKSENQYRDLFEKSADAILIIKNEKFVDCNQATVKMLGYRNKKELLKTHPSQLSPEMQPCGRESYEKANEMMEIAFKNGSNRFEWDHKKRNGEVFPVEVLLTAIPADEGVFLHVVWRDITERKQAEKERIKLEKQLRKSQKLETIGTLAGGIAHEFNNILTPIIGYSEMILTDENISKATQQDLKNIFNAANRAKELVEQILLFGKQVEKEHKPVYLHLILKEAIKLLRPSIPTTIQIHQKIESENMKVLGDTTQLHQVIINLCTNAFHSMEETGGQLDIELTRAVISKKRARLYPRLATGNFLRLSVTDTGLGMDESVKERIFEPFFTTKSVNKGTGMGLSVVHGIIQNHQGEILVESKQGVGTSFHVYLPVSTVDIKPVRNKEIPRAINNETILIVDDDKAVASMLKQMVKKLGYEVDLFESSNALLSELNRNYNKYSLLISDLTMPENTGLEITEKLHQYKPEIPVIIITGYGDKLTLETQEQFGINKVLPKPISMIDMAHAIREVLN